MDQPLESAAFSVGGNTPVVESQLSMAGTRLAAQLNRVLRKRRDLTIREVVLAE
jgi:hypothetical protein